MPKIHELAEDTDNTEQIPFDLRWKVAAYNTILEDLGPASALLLEKLVSELEDEAAAVTIAGPPLDLSKLTTNLDILQTTQIQD